MNRAYLPLSIAYEPTTGTWYLDDEMQDDLVALTSTVCQLYNAVLATLQEPDPGKQSETT